MQQKLNLRHKTIKLSETLQDIGIDDDFLGKTSKYRQQEAKLDQQNYAKLRNFCTVKETTD